MQAGARLILMYFSGIRHRVMSILSLHIQIWSLVKYQIWTAVYDIDPIPVLTLWRRIQSRAAGRAAVSIRDSDLSYDVCVKSDQNRQMTVNI